MILVGNYASKKLWCYALKTGKTITFLDGQKVELKTGNYMIHFDKDTGYSIAYVCKEPQHEQCNLSLPVK